MSSHSHNTIRIAINDEATLKELIKDPDVVVRCKDAIVKGVAKYALNAAQTELNTSIRTFVKEAIHEYCRPDRGNENKWFKPVDSVWGSVTLTDEAKETIKSAVNDALLDKCFDIVKDIAGNNAQQSMDIAIADKILQIAGIDVEALFKQRLDVYIQERLGSKR